MDLQHATSLLLGYLWILFDIADGILHGLDLLGFLIRDFKIKGFFKRHDELYTVKRVRTEIVYEGGAGRDFGLFDAELVDDDLLHLIFYPRHANSSCMHRPRNTNSSVYMALGKAGKRTGRRGFCN